MNPLILAMLILTGIVAVGAFIYPFYIWSTMPDCFEERVD